MDPNTLNLDLDPGFWPNLDQGSRVILKMLKIKNFKKDPKIREMMFSLWWLDLE